MTRNLQNMRPCPIAKLPTGDLLAIVRNEQLRLAQEGRYRESARYAAVASRLRRGDKSTKTVDTVANKR